MTKACRKCNVNRLLIPLKQMLTIGKSAWCSMVSYLVSVCDDQEAQIILLTETQQVVCLSAVPGSISGHHILPFLVVISVHLGLAQYVKDLSRCEGSTGSLAWRLLLAFLTGHCVLIDNLNCVLTMTYSNCLARINS